MNLVSVCDGLPEIGKNVLLYVKYRDHEPNPDGEWEPRFCIGMLLEEKFGEDKDGSENFFGIPTEGSEWCIAGWSYYFVPEVLYWCELPDVPDGYPETASGLCHACIHRDYCPDVGNKCDHWRRDE